jgi:orotate phosphoribosyltransferase
MPTDRPALFESGDFTLHSGAKSRWRINCRAALIPEDWRTLALMASERVEPFGLVWGIPRGGLSFEEALRPYITPGAKAMLIVDDVWTTGASMEGWRTILADLQVPARGVVVFARSPVPPWVTVLFYAD